jgi:hypothetical protein
LHDRIHFKESGGFASLRQPQLQLKPFDRERLETVALRLRELYPMPNRERVLSRVSNQFIDRLVAQVTAGFKGDVGVVPRQFLRELVNVMDLVDENEDYFPDQAYKFSMASFQASLSPEEQASADGRKLAAPVPDDESDEDFVPAEQVW